MLARCTGHGGQARRYGPGIERAAGSGTRSEGQKMTPDRLGMTETRGQKLTPETCLSASRCSSKKHQHNTNTTVAETT